jgi:hypothetical protein
MARSNPTIKSTDVPTVGPPGDRMAVPVTVRQGGPDPVASDGSCTSRNLDILAWRTPVKLFVDGTETASTELCLAPGKSRQTTLSGSLPRATGPTDVRVVVYSVGGNAYDFEPAVEEENDDVSTVVTVEAGARDTSRETMIDKLSAWVGTLAGNLSGGAKWAVPVAVLVLAVLILVR